MKSKLKILIEQELLNKLELETVVNITLSQNLFICEVKLTNSERLHIVEGKYTSQGIYLNKGFTNQKYRRQGIAQIIREIINEVLKEENKGTLYTDSKEFIKTEISPLKEFWNKMVTEGKATKQENVYKMI